MVIRGANYNFRNYFASETRDIWRFYKAYFWCFRYFWNNCYLICIVCLIEDYEIPGLKGRLTVGSNTKPYLYDITRGQRSAGGPKNKSGIFHVKIGAKQHRLRLKYTGARYCLFDCCEKTCGAHHKMMPKPEMIKEFPRYYKMKNGRSRARYYVDLDDPRVYDLSNWTVIEHPTKPHGFQKPGCDAPIPCDTYLPI